ncbi:hypothetical protein [Megalodesulfovibrio paquesii]
MRSRFETWAAAGAMAEAGCHDEALGLREGLREALREEEQQAMATLEALRARRASTIVVAANAEFIPLQIQHMASMLQRFTADVLLATVQTLPQEMVTALQRAISAEHYVVHVQYSTHFVSKLTRLISTLSHVQFAVCIGASNLLCSKKSPFPVFTV